MIAFTVVGLALAACDRERGTSNSRRFTKVLGVRVDPIEGQENQYLVHARPGTVDFTPVGELIENQGTGVVLTLADGTHAEFRFAFPQDGPLAEELSTALGIKVTAVPTEVRQYLVHAPVGSVDFTKIGTVHQDLGYAVGVTLNDGMEIGFRFAGPTPEELSTILGAHVVALPNEPSQYLVYARRNAVDLSKLGTVDTDLGYAAGVTLRGGLKVGFRFAGPSAREIADLLGLEVESIAREPQQYLVYARRRDADLKTLGTVHVDAGDNVGITLSDGSQIGLRFAGPSASELSKALGVKVAVIKEETRQYYVYAAPGTVDFSKIGSVHVQEGMNVGVTLHDGGKIGFRYARVPPLSPPVRK